ncbi:CO dehydrogenase maturation factor [Desulfatibacillum alkenivorans DSM 16219]|uniref:CO dehydrogenase maturation factor n=1 Tax=Desulfatibacillum alkenivorans DSM 16219 TaxID=1121393 RepID=A0A1M7AS68_9BACT|nr:AAA family ATPase [Desulfatibacillum alkenivorans]SHL45632.1 CO dehydrogenase maturation factor [Desulfatibacillum alkenivorans DSM 16219]
MQYSIALAGKGGVGKTTIAGMLVKYMVSKGKKPILAVDADSNANFNEVLGLEVEETLGGAREKMKKGDVPSGMTKDLFIEMKMEEAICESEDYDLIVMGQPEGSGCYCAANSLLTRFLERLAENYKYLVIDNEAGMEHISRLTTKDVDILLIVSDPSRRGLQAAGRINKLAQDLSIGMGKSYLILNQAKGEPSEALLKVIEDEGLELAGTVPEDELVYDFDLNGQPTIELPEESASQKAVFAIFDKIIEP